MEQFWNKKRINLLHAGESEMLELFLDQYQPVIFTWMYYQVGADANIAADLTGRTFSLAMQKLGEFRPADGTMFQWLREQAKAARDEGLLKWQLKPQRPWAWSQLPDALLKTLAAIRSEPLNETAAANPFVQEIVQATLAELEQNERELMMHRYNHLDTSENIANETGLPVEKVNDLLYKCRHSFRRVFFHIVSSVNPGFAESTTGIGIEVLDNNLEKLLRATAMYQVPSEAQAMLIREQAFAAASQTAPAAGPKQASRIAIIGIAAGILLLFALAALLLKSEKTQEPAEAPKPAASEQGQQTSPKSEPSKPQQTDDKVDEEELKMVFRLGQEGNVQALLEILKSGQYTSQVAAAHFVGKLGDPSAVKSLKDAENQWYPDGPQNNPFYEAMAEIAERYPGRVQLQQKQPAAPTPAPNEEKKAAEIFAIEGSVRDVSGKPIEGAKLEVLSNPLLSSKEVKAIGSTVSNAEGFYKVKGPIEGPFFIRCTSPAHNLDVRQAFWGSKERVCKYDINGSTIVTGNVVLADQPLSGLRLIMSDTLEPEKAAFEAETETGKNGSFLFGAVAPGFYHLFSIKENKKLVRLGSFETHLHEDLNLQFNLRPISVVFEYPDPNMVSEGRLAYQMEHSKLHDERTAKALKNGKLRFENVFAGSYMLQVQLRNGATLQQQIDVLPDSAEQLIVLQPVEHDLVSVKGKIIGNSPTKLFLLSMDQNINIPLDVNADGTYELVDIPGDTYSLAGFIKGQLIEFTGLRFDSGPQIVMDLNLEQILAPFSPLYVVTTNKNGIIVPNVRIVLDNNDINAAYTSGQGAFIAAPAGPHNLHAELEGYGSADVKIELKKAPLNTEPAVDNIVHLEL